MWVFMFVLFYISPHHPALIYIYETIEMMWNGFYFYEQKEPHQPQVAERCHD